MRGSWVLLERDHLGGERSESNASLRWRGSQAQLTERSLEPN